MKKRRDVAFGILLVWVWVALSIGLLLGGEDGSATHHSVAYQESDWADLGGGFEMRVRVALPTSTPTLTPTPTPTHTPTPRPEGTIIRVTTLKDGWDLDGSLRQAIYANVDGPRIITFDVAGTIKLYNDLIITRPFVTIAGETAPPGGITLVGGELHVRSHDVTIRHLRIRTGDDPSGKSNPLRILAAGWDTHHVVIDHCSISWGDDEMIQIGQDVHDVVISNCLVSEGIHNAANGDYSMALNVGNRAQNVTVFGNLFTSIWRRSPRYGPGSSGNVINNVVYDWWSTAMHVDNGGGPTKVNIVGNVYVRGPNTPKANACILLSNPGAEVYLSDNIGVEPLIKGELSTIVTRPPMPFGEAMPSGQVLEYVLANAGALPWDRDLVDQRAINSVRGGTPQ